MILVTGGAGFIGSNIVHELNRRGEHNIVVVDSLASKTSFMKIRNLEGARFLDFIDKTELRRALQKKRFSGSQIRAILHQGACSNTLESDGQYMMDNNFTYAKELLEFAISYRIPFIYASTAAVYGISKSFTEDEENERPLNVYGFSKLVLDNYVRKRLSSSNNSIIGLRYFNVYGPREQHKGDMASVIHRFSIQLKQNGVIQMFQGNGGCGDGEQRRDWVFVKDVVNINLFFAFGPPRHGVVNVGTGYSSSFNEVADALMRIQRKDKDKGKIQYIPFPADIKDRYQSFTEADITRLRVMGYNEPFVPLGDGIKRTFLDDKS